MERQDRVLVGKYALDRLIAAGGMGEVYQATNLQLGRLVAVKLLQPDRATDETSRRRFLREARAAARVDHENVCEVFDCGIDEDGTIFTVMALLRGAPLAQAIAGDAPFPVERAVDISLQILSALSAARKVGVVHRDLKPDNVFLTHLGAKQDFVKVLDFGISKIFGDSADDGAALTQTDKALGTPSYMAPEQARCAKSADWRVDIYAAGAILYEMLTRRRPVEGESGSEILWNLWNEPMVPPRAHRPELSTELEAVVMRALSRDPEKRYQRAESFAIALGKAAGVDVPADLDIRAADQMVPLATAPTVTADGDESLYASTVTKTVERVKTSAGRSLLPALFGVVVAVGAALWLAPELLPVHEMEPSELDSPEPAAARSRPTPSQTTTPPSVVGSIVSEGDSSALSPTEALDHAADADVALDDAPLRANNGARRARVTLAGLPRGALVTVDGRQLESDSFDILGEELVELIVQAPGHRTWRQSVRAERDQILEVALTPATRRSESQAALPSPDRALIGTITDFERVP